MNRRTIRYGAAAFAAAMAAIYYLIGVGVLTVAEGQSEDPSILTFGAAAGTAFLVGAILLVVRDDYRLWILGAIFQVFVVWGYISVAPQRTPAFEAWGLTLRVLQVPLLAALVYLSWAGLTSRGRGRGMIGTTR